MKLRAGMILVPKPEHKELFRNPHQYVVKEKDVKPGNSVGNMWMVKPNNESR